MWGGDWWYRRAEEHIRIVSKEFTCGEESLNLFKTFGCPRVPVDEMKIFAFDLVGRATDSRPC